MNPVRVLVVDDSAFMRKAITQMITSDPGVVVIDTARDGREAVDKTIALRPDLVTLDIEMPRMNGLDALREIMDKRPTPVVMVSSLTTDGARETLAAMELGALDFVPKNLAEMSVNILKIKQDLVEKIKILSRKRVMRRPDCRHSQSSCPPEAAVPRQVVVPRTAFESYTRERRIGIVVIGTSTGGPMALQRIIPHLPSNFPVGIVVAQHMPAAFTGAFADRLNGLSQVTVREAREGDVIKPGLVLVAPGGRHMKVRRKTGIDTCVTITDEPREALYKPSVTELMRTAAEIYPGRALGVMLTGMGDDGCAGAREIKKSGGKMFAQDEPSCVVYGMPRAVVEGGLADKVLPLETVAGEIVNAV
ncbi:MAG: chemotaxis response regulator protein-glutamate methylesterase [Nitrospirae bacterium]|nr:chemotaxis response regulator protein-glutamate methylesterase [Nitrospirota bacterium]